MSRRVFRDTKTRREVWQLTDGDFECVAPYMDVPAWSRDDRFLIFTSNAAGSWQPYRLEIETGEMRQLVDAVGGFRSVALDPIHGEVFCQDGDTIIAAHIESLEKRLALDYGKFPDASIKLADFGGGKGRTPALNHDGSLVVVGGTDEKGRGYLVVARTDGSHEFEIVELKQKGLVACHILFCPADDNIIAVQTLADFQNDPHASPENRTAEWRVERKSGRISPLVLPPPGFRATHATWGSSGKRFYFHRKSVPNWVPTALCSVNDQGEDLRVHYETSQWKLGHSAASPDEKWLVADSQDADNNPLVLASTDGKEQHILCWPNMSQKTSKRPHQRSTFLPPHTDVDTHPGWSATGQYVHYTSDISGRSQIYAVPVSDLTS